MLFNLFINDLTRHINDVGSGTSVGDTPLSILLYADDIVLIADSELKLQSLLTRPDQWCKQWDLVISANRKLSTSEPKVLRGLKKYFSVVKLLSNLSINISILV